MPRATRVGPRYCDENALLSTVREVVPPGGARSRTSYGGAVGRPDPRRPAAGAADQRPRAPRGRGRPRRAGPAASASSEPAALRRPASGAASRRRARPRQRGAPAAPAAPAGAPTPARVPGPARKVERASSAHERLAPGTGRAEHAGPAPGGTAASPRGSQAHALSRAAAPRRMVAGHVLSPRPHAGAVARRVTDRQRASPRSEPEAAPVASAGPAAPFPAPAWEAETSADRHTRWDPS
jgi:hypothetical protein